MKEQIKPVLTQLGKIWGRDAIYLDKTVVVNEQTFKLLGEFNGALCEHLPNDSFQKYQITFQSVRWFQMTELDYNEIEYHSSFDEVKNSQRVNDLVEKDCADGIGKIDHAYRHFVFRTYDTVFQFIGKNFQLELL